MGTVKICGRCRKDLLLNSFSKDRTTKDGLQYWCKLCQKEHKDATRGVFTRQEYALNVSDDFGYWFSGLADGEAHFGASIGINKGYRNLVTVFLIGLRIDDVEVLYHIKHNLKVGRVLAHHRWKTNTPLQRHQADFRIGCAQQLQEVIIPLFDRYPLRTKKQNDYKVWRKIIMEYGWNGTRQRFIDMINGKSRLSETQ